MFKKIKNYISKKRTESKQKRESRNKTRLLVEKLKRDHDETFEELKEEIRQRLHSEEGYYYGQKSDKTGNP
jgi:predicted transcriptional regulator